MLCSRFPLAVRIAIDACHLRGVDASHADARHWRQALCPVFLSGPSKSELSARRLMDGIHVKAPASVLLQNWLLIHWADSFKVGENGFVRRSVSIAS
jgi:hypothetical protein